MFTCSHVHINKALKRHTLYYLDTRMSHNLPFLSHFQDTVDRLQKLVHCGKHELSLWTHVHKRLNRETTRPILPIWHRWLQY